MTTLTIPPGNSTLVVALMISAENEGLLPKALAPVEALLPIEITMPCGNVLKLTAIAELPAVDVPCPCGDPTHWLMKYRIKQYQ